MPTSSDWDAEAGSAPTRGQAVFVSTQDPGEGVTLVRGVKCWKVEVMPGSSPWPSQRAEWSRGTSLTNSLLVSVW